MFRYLSKNRSALLLILIVLASFLWMTSQVRGPRGAGLFERAAGALAYPFVKLIDKTADVAKGVWEGYFYLVGLERENAALEEANGRLFAENARLKDTITRASRLDDLRELQRESGYEALTARVVGRDATTWFRSAWIDKGEDDGVRKNMPAAVYTGIAGRVMRTLGGSSRVLLITDRGSSVSCVTERTREPGILAGTGGELTRFQFIGKHADVAVGDLVVTSGLDRIFPAGMPVGVVVRADKAGQGYFQEIEVRPTADIKKLEELSIIKYSPEPLPRPEPEPGAEGRKKK